MTFKEWIKLQEVGTSTGSVAGFARMTLPMVRRQFMPHWGEDDPFFTSKKKKKEVLKERTGPKKTSRAWVQCYLSQTPPTFEYSKEHFEDKGEILARTDYEGVCKKMAMEPQYRKETLKKESIALKLKSSQDKWTSKKVEDVFISRYIYLPEIREYDKKRAEARMKVWKEAQTPESLQVLKDEWKRILNK